MKVSPGPLARHGLLFSALALATGTAAQGQTSLPCPQAVLTLTEAAAWLRIDRDELERLADLREVPGRRIGSSWRFSCAALSAWLGGEEERGDGGDRAPGSSPSPGALTTRDLRDATGAGTARGQAGTTVSVDEPPAAGQDEQPIGEASEERPAEDIFLRGQRVLLGPGEVVMDVGQFYSRSDLQQLVTDGTGVGLATLEQQAFSSLLVGRVGLLDETELFASTAFYTQDTHQFLGSTRVASSGASEFGGLRLGVRRTLLREGAGRPDIIVTLDGQVPTGDRSSGIGGGVVFVKSVDPVVLFASTNYLHTFGRSNAMRSEAGDRFDVSVGYGLALNDTLALSMAVSGLFVGTATLNDAILRQPDSFSGRFGLTSWLAEGLYIEPSVSFGLSGPGSSVAFGVTMPYAF